MQTTIVKNKFNTFLSEIASAASNFDASSVGSNVSSNLKYKKMKRFVKNSKYLPFAIVGVIVVVILIIGWSSFASRTGNPSPIAAVNSATDSRVDLKKPIATQTINKTFEFPLKDVSGKEVSKFKYEVQNAELREEIIIKGQKAKSVRGRAFLIFALKITNNYDKSIQISAKDFVRLTVGNSTEKMAADIHNDPVEVQAISTKITRLGFPINDDDRNIVLQVGEINGPKQSINISLK